MSLEERIHNHLDTHAFGRSRKEIHRKFRNEYNENEIDDTLERMKTNGWVLEVGGKFKWQPK